MAINLPASFGVIRRGRGAVNTFLDIQAEKAKAEEADQALQFGRMRLQDNRNKLEEYQRQKTSRDLVQRVRSGDAQAAQELAQVDPDALQAEHTRHQETMKAVAPRLGPAVQQMRAMLKQGATPAQVMQWGISNYGPELASGAANGLGVDDFSEEALAGYDQELSAYTKPEKSEFSSPEAKLLEDIRRMRASGDEGRARRLEAIMQADYDAKNRSNRPQPREPREPRQPTTFEQASAIDRNPGAYSPAQQAWAKRTLEGSNNQGITVSVDEAGNQNVQIGGPAGAPVKNAAGNTVLAIQEMYPTFQDYGRRLFDPKLSRNVAGVTGDVLTSLRGLANQNDITAAIAQVAKKYGGVELGDRQISETRQMAHDLELLLAPVFAGALKGTQTEKDAVRLKKAIGLMYTTSDLAMARFSYNVLDNYIRNMHTSRSRVVNTGEIATGALPPSIFSPTPRLVIPGPSAPGSTSPSMTPGGKPANWNQMTPAQKAAWYRN